MLKRFQDLPAAAALDGSEIVPVTQAGGDVQTTVQDIADLASAGSGTVDSVVAGTGIDVDATDPTNPEVALDAASIASLALADTSVQPGDNVSVLTNDAGYTNNVGTVTSVNIANSTGLTASGGPITGSGSLTYTLSANLQAWHGLATSAKQDADADLTAIAGLSPSNDDIIQRKAGAWTNRTMSQLATDIRAASPIVVPIGIACSDETTALAAGTAKVTFRMPYAMTLQSVRASLTTAQTSGSIFTVDINESGTTILSTKITIDNTEKTSTTAVTAPVISDTSLADDAEITIDIDQIGDGTAKGLKVWLVGYKT
jgi:hypothetical protein